MDVNSMMTQAALTAQEEYENQIVKEVWADFPTNGDMSNFTAKDFDKDPNMCDGVYELQGSDAYNLCYTAAISANTPEHNALVTRYIQAQEKGYKKDFESFKKKTGTLSAIGDLAGGILTSIFGNKTNSTNTSGNTRTDYTRDEVTDEKPKTGLYIAIGAVAIVGIGAAIYFFNRKK
jgi:hypothetical protein